MPVIDLRKPSATGSKSAYTPDEIAELKKAGWKEGAPVPVDLLTAIREKLKEPIPQIGTPKDFKRFDQLTEQEKAKLVGGPSEAAVSSELPDDNIAGLDPGLKALLNWGNKATAEQSKPEPEKAPEPTDSGAAKLIHDCPRCGFRVDDPDPTEPTNEDKLAFVAAVLGGNRFRKTVPLFDGSVDVVFRSLTPNESDLAYTQTVLDNQAVVLDEANFFRTLLDYRLCMSIEHISLGGVKTEVPDIFSDEWKTDEIPKGKTKLMYVVPYVYDNILKTESIRRAIGAAFFRFQRLVEKLEARAVDQGFWKATEAPRS